MQLFTVKEVAAILRVCTATVYSMIERGELEHVRVSNSIRVCVSARRSCGGNGDHQGCRHRPEPDKGADG
ncbi:MAG: helix-turn-helix domain-containing protein [Polyangiaceae bacterium]|nr:helix-turn-helix domain-containing protein [Polyangiaceae bacterium]